ncbi:hypothetical protein Hypma_005639 [Hypsizygus marmoreus]|uniref:F-box domain-containing protein n=1 Tax=Hypsizygus marmoreus TaxID=39966 RepID=A0A369JZ75_HYPMA|nr:hypothetical protein Hypma_005639 [Hypsizygus marmoreus]
MSPIPPKVVNSIIDMVHDDNDSRTLKACSLVSKLFHSASQRHLYETVTVKFSFTALDDEHPAQPLLEILLAHPDLAHYIRSLRLLNYTEGYRVVGGRHEAAPDTILPQLFKLLGSLTSFTLIGGPDPASMVNTIVRPTPQLTSQFTLELLKLFSRVNLTEIRISRIAGIPFSYIASLCPHLKHLSITQAPNYMDISISPERIVDTTYPELAANELPLAVETQLPGRLDRVTIDASSASQMFHFRDRIDGRSSACLTLSHLRELNFTGLDLVSALVVSGIITDAAKRLESFSWDNMGFDDDQFHSYCYILTALAETTNLRMLRLVLANPYDFFAPSAPCNIPSMFERLSRNNKLEELIIEYDTRCPNLNPGSHDQWGWASSLGALLRKTSYFPYLRKVYVTITLDREYYLSGFHEGLFPAYAKRLNNAFSGLISQDKLCLRFVLRDTILAPIWDHSFNMGYSGLSGMGKIGVEYISSIFEHNIFGVVCLRI